MTTTPLPARPSAATVPATRRISPAPAGAAPKPLLVADAWNDWVRHYAAVRDGAVVYLWTDGGRTKILAKCGRIGEANTTPLGGGIDCQGCQEAHRTECRETFAARAVAA